MGLSDEDDHGPFPTSMVRAHDLDEAGWVVRTLSDSRSTVSRGPLARAIAACIGALLLIPVLDALTLDLGPLAPMVLLLLLLGLVAAFVLQAGRGAEPVFRRLRLDRRGLVIDEIRGDWTLHESQVLTAEGTHERALAYDDVVSVQLEEEWITIEQHAGAPWRVGWLPEIMAEEVVEHLQRTLSDREEPSVASEHKAALQRLVEGRKTDRSAGG